MSPCQSSLIFLNFMHGYKGCMHESKPYHHGRVRAQNCIACSTSAIRLLWQPLRQLQAHNSIAISANCAPGRPPIVRHNDCHLESDCTPALRPAHLKVPRRSQHAVNKILQLVPSMPLPQSSHLPTGPPSEELHRRRSAHRRHLSHCFHCRHRFYCGHWLHCGLLLLPQPPPPPC